MASSDEESESSSTASSCASAAAEDDAPKQKQKRRAPPAAKSSSAGRRRRRDGNGSLDALRQFREFSKRMKLDAGLTIRALAGGDVVELDDLLPPEYYDNDDEDEDEGDEDGDGESSDGLSEPDFVVDPEAGLREDNRDESSIDPETGDFVAPKPKPEPEEAEVKVEAEEADEEKKDEEGEAKKEEDEKSKGANAMNVRRNIREVMDEKQLDASTLAAQRLESERLARVQEQQRIIREVRRQIELSRQDKAQQRVISLLQGRAAAGGSSLLRRPAEDGEEAPADTITMQDVTLVKMPSGSAKKVPNKFNLPPSVSIAPVKPDAAVKKDVVEIVDSSSEESSSESAPSSESDDCIMLSDSELPPSPEAEEDPQNSGLHVNDVYNIPDEQGRVVINIGHPENEEDIFLAPQIGRIIKPHQIGGVRFLFDNIIESVERFSTSTGFGCILAHSMGLGKTLQIVCFCDIFLRHTNSKTVLCIMPINTLQNWVAEFNMWLPLDPASSPLSAQGEVRPRNFPIYVLNDSHKTLNARSKVIKEWTDTGGVLMIGYELYRLLSLKKNKKPRKRSKKNDPDFKKKGSDKDKNADSAIDIDGDLSKDSDMKDVTEKKGKQVDTPEEKNLLDEMYEALVKPGPDLVICDEGHRIKNSHSNISYALKQMRTKRRIVLTGYPLQNNLLEYWCMVDFVRPNYLGTKTEFSNMFERPIQNGQCIDSTPQDIRLMRYRAHVLHSLLVGFVQRRSHAVLQSTLPQKEEYVLLVRMSELQRKLYNVFMNEIVRKTTVPNPLKAFAVCCKIWNHPDVLYYFLKKRNESAAIVDFDLEIEDNPLNPVNPINPIIPTANGKKGKERKPRGPAKKKDKAPPKTKAGISTATIPPNASANDKTAPANNPSFGQIGPELAGSSQNYNNQPSYPSNGGDMKNTFGQMPANPAMSYPPYNNYQQQYPQNSYYGQNGSYDPSYNSGYYQNQNYNNYNYGTPNAQLPGENNSVPQQSVVPRYPSNPEYNNPPYWGSENNFYNNQNQGYYQNQPQSNYQMAQNSFPVYDAYGQQNPAYGYNQNPMYANNPNAENIQGFNNSQNMTNPQFNSQSNAANTSSTGFDNAQAPTESNMQPFNQSSFANIANTQDSSMLDNKQAIQDEISTLCWPITSDNNDKPEPAIPSKLLNDIKNEAKTDSDGEIKIADLDTKKVIINEKIKTPPPEIKSEVKEEVKSETVAEDSKCSIEKDDKNIDTAPKSETNEDQLKSNDQTESKSNEKDTISNEKNKNCEKGSDSDVEDKKDKDEGEKKSDKYEEVSYEWANDLLKNYTPGIIENSAKMEILFCILDESIRMGDRLLLFSQSLFTLNLIEDFLQKNFIPGTDIRWFKNKSYYRLDGSTSALEREKLINEFNSSTTVLLFLVSTRAGSLGINLVGANRVVVFDASWNPCHDTQAVCRVYRYGQQKPCFVYRLVMDSCLEKKIYDRQINKQGMADRVVDECNPDAVLSLKEVTNLCFDNDDKESEQKEFSENCSDKYSDLIMKKIIDEHRKTLNREPFQHESLLVDRKEKKLSSAEKRLAKRGYELEKKAASNPKPAMAYRTIRAADGSLIQRPIMGPIRSMQQTGNRWIPADVWHRQGMTAQEMTLPLDVVIPTNSPEKSNIVLKAGQRVMVIKSPRGIYMQLESGKIIAIKSSLKAGQQQNKPPEPKEMPKKILPMCPTNANLPGSLKNNSAITVTSKSARGGMHKVITRPPILQKKIGTPIRPLMGMAGPRMLNPRIAGVNTNLQVRPFPVVRGRPPLQRGPRPLIVQNNMTVRMQDSSTQATVTEQIDLADDMDKDEDMDSNGSSQISNSTTNQNEEQIPEAKGSNCETQAENSGNSPCGENVVNSLHLRNAGVPAASPIKPIPIESKMPIQSSPNKSAVGTSSKECNIQIQNKNVLHSYPDLGFSSDLTVKRSFAPSAQGNANIVNPMKIKPLQTPVHVSPSDSPMERMSTSRTSDSDVAEDDDVTKGDRLSAFRPNLANHPKASALKNYRHQKPPYVGGQKPPFDYPAGGGSSPTASLASTSSTTPTPPPYASSMTQNQKPAHKEQDKFESSLFQLEKTASAMMQPVKKGSMSDFQQSLTNITQTYSPDGAGSSGGGSKVDPAYRPGPKSRKKKVAEDSSKIADANQQVRNQTSGGTTGAVSAPSAGFAPSFNGTEPYGEPGGFQQPVVDPAAHQPYNSYPVYPSAVGGGAYPPYQPAAAAAPPYYQGYPPTAYPAAPYGQYPPAAPYPSSYPPNPYPGYPPYPNPNHQW